MVKSMKFKIVIDMAILFILLLTAGYGFGYVGEAVNNLDMSDSITVER